MDPKTQEQELASLQRENLELHVGNTRRQLEEALHAIAFHEDALSALHTRREMLQRALSVIDDGSAPQTVGSAVALPLVSTQYAGGMRG